MPSPTVTFFRSTLVAGAALGLAGLLAGCPDKKPKTPSCDGDKDCKDGLVCVDKRCVQCANNDDCPDGKVCKDNACIAKPQCSTDDDCADGKVCKDGACMACASDGECGPGGTCESGACNRPKKCSVDEDCADDEDCVDGLCQKPWQAPTADGPSCSLETVYFAYDSDAVAGPERDRLDKNSQCLEKEAKRNVTLVGHTDASGTDEYNIALSERRARAVADYLSRLGVDPARFQIVPKGETEVTGSGDDKDRRVESKWQ